MEDLLIGAEEVTADYRPARISERQIPIPESVTLDIGALHLVLSPAAWDQVINAVQTAVRDGRKHAVAEQVRADMAANPIVAESPVLALYLACEGIEVDQ